MSIWEFLGSNTQKQSLWNIASLSAPKILVSYFQGRMTRCPKISIPDVKFWESYFKKSVFENLEITFWDSLKKNPDLTGFYKRLWICFSFWNKKVYSVELVIKI